MNLNFKKDSAACGDMLGVQSGLCSSAFRSIIDGYR